MHAACLFGCHAWRKIVLSVAAFGVIPLFPYCYSHQETLIHLHFRKRFVNIFLDALGHLSTIFSSYSLNKKWGMFITFLREMEDIELLSVL